MDNDLKWIDVDTQHPDEDYDIIMVELPNENYFVGYYNNGEYMNYENDEIVRPCFWLKLPCLPKKQKGVYDIYDT